MPASLIEVQAIGTMGPQDLSADTERPGNAVDQQVLMRAVRSNQGVNANGEKVDNTIQKQGISSPNLKEHMSQDGDYKILAVGAEETGSEDGDDGSEIDVVGAVKIKPNTAAGSVDIMLLEEEALPDRGYERSRVGSSEISGVDSESIESEVADFRGGDTSEDEDSKPNDQTNCMFCKQKEDDDPSDEFEAYLNCIICGEHSHRQCAQENNALAQESDTQRWLCAHCVELERTSGSPEEKLSRPRSSAPRLVRDLLPVTRGIQKRDSHSIFAHPLMSEERDMEGFRKLRKRKSPVNDPPGTIEKRRRKATPSVFSETASNKAHAEGDGGDDDDDVDELAISPIRGPSRSTRRASQKHMPIVRVIQHRFPNNSPARLILGFRLDQTKVAEILARKPRPKRARDRRRPPRIPPPLASPFHSVPHKFPALPSTNLIFPSILHERDHEVNSKPYGGILTEAEADTSRGLPGLKDREIFEAARKEAEEERRKASIAAETDITNSDNTVNAPTTSRSNRTVSGPPSKIKCIQFGRFIIDTFYAAPYPEEYSHEARLFICEFCLKYLPSEAVAYRHKLKCPAKHPPGDEIYRDESVSIWEVDGRKKTEYCQCLCLMAKMFLGSKTLYYDVEPFLFYILTENDELGYHFVGYFSKEKRPQSLNNVSCILVMPIHQRKGYATFLIDFSYLLTRIEGKEGSPEKPLSDMGLTAYRSYWDLTIARHLLGLSPLATQSRTPSTPKKNQSLTPKSISARTLITLTGMTADDVIHSLERLYAFVCDPVTKIYGIRHDRKLYEQIVHDNVAKGYRQLRPDKLIWTPYVVGRSDCAALEGQPMQTVQPREGTDEDQSPEAEMGADVNMTDDIGHGGATQGRQDQDEACKDEDASTLPKIAGVEIPVKPSCAEQRTTNGVPTDYLGHKAPGPPPTSTISTTISTEITQLDNINGTELVADTKHLIDNKLSNANPSTLHVLPPDVQQKLDNEEETKEVNRSKLTGYALAYRTQNIPPSRFEIDPPIPSSMLMLGRGRSRKRAFGSNTPGGGGGAASMMMGSTTRRRSNLMSPAAYGAAGKTGMNGVADGSITPTTMGLRGMHSSSAAVQLRSSPRRAAAAAAVAAVSALASTPHSKLAADVDPNANGSVNGNADGESYDDEAPTPTTRLSRSTAAASRQRRSLSAGARSSRRSSRTRRKVSNRDGGRDGGRFVELSVDGPVGDGDMVEGDSGDGAPELEPELELELEPNPEPGGPANGVEGVQRRIRRGRSSTRPQTGVGSEEAADEEYRDNDDDGDDDDDGVAGGGADGDHRAEEHVEDGDGDGDEDEDEDEDAEGSLEEA